MAFFLMSGIVLGLLDHLHTFWQLYLIELLEVLIGLRLFEVGTLDVSDRVGHATDSVWHVGFHKFKSYGNFTSGILIICSQ